MILGFSTAQILRAYLAAAVALGAAAYVSGVVTADICHAYAEGIVVGQPLEAGGNSARARPMLCA